MVAERAFIHHEVGVGKVNEARDVRNLQELLIAAGEALPEADGRWGPATARALEKLQEESQKEHPRADIPLRPIVKPDDPILLFMAIKGQMSIPLPKKAGWPGVLQLHKWFQSHHICYNKGAQHGKGNRALWGVAGRRDYVVQTTAGHYRRGPVEMDCTTYVNLMLSVYQKGHAHTLPYSADCSHFGGNSSQHCARDRYGFPLVHAAAQTGQTSPKTDYFSTAEELSHAISDSPRLLFVVEAAYPPDKVHHMALLRSERIYECTTGVSPACIDRPLEVFLKHKTGQIFYLFGPR
jgi:hypothetical protein